METEKVLKLNNLCTQQPQERVCDKKKTKTLMFRLPYKAYPFYLWIFANFSIWKWVEIKNTHTHTHFFDWKGSVKSKKKKNKHPHLCIKLKCHFVWVFQYFTGEIYIFFVVAVVSNAVFLVQIKQIRKNKMEWNEKHMQVELQFHSLPQPNVMYTYIRMYQHSPDACGYARFSIHVP